jgi:hypothetical protein
VKFFPVIVIEEKKKYFLGPQKNASEKWVGEHKFGLLKKKLLD